MNRYRLCPYRKSRITTRLFVLFAWPSLREKFREVRNTGSESDFLGYLDSLRRVLEKPFLKREEVEKYVPSGYGVKSKYIELLEDIGEVPAGESSRKIFIKIAGGYRYREYRKRAEKALEHLNMLSDFLSRNMLDGKTEDRVERFVHL